MTATEEARTLRLELQRILRDSRAALDKSMGEALQICARLEQLEPAERAPTPTAPRQPRNAPFRGAPIVARFSDVCVVCLAVVEQGEQALYFKREIAHAACGQPLPPRRESHG
jgi:hypothetical protein